MESKVCEQCGENFDTDTDVYDICPVCTYDEFGLSWVDDEREWNEWPDRL